MTRKQSKEEWVKLNICSFCPGSQRHTCTSFRCQPAYEKAEEYFENVIAKEKVCSSITEVCSSAEDKVSS